MDVSIIIVNWNTREILYNCLQSVYDQSGEIVFEVIVIDNASSDGSVDMIKNDFPEVILIENKKNHGFAAANNQGIARAKGRYILLLNSDTVILDKAIEKTVKYADRRPEVAVMGCQVLEDYDVIQMTCFRFPSVVNLFLSTSGLARIFKSNRFLGREWMLWWGRSSEREVDVVSGMFMLVRRAAINEVGVLDEDYFVYCEEADWCYRFVKAGWKVLFWPGVQIIHVHGGSHSSKQAYVKMFVQKQKSLLVFIKKHRGLLRYWLGRMILGLSFGFRVCICVMTIVFKKTGGKNSKRMFGTLIKHWLAFKFCAFGLEPDKKRYLSVAKVVEYLEEKLNFGFAAFYALFLRLFAKKTCRVVLYYHGVKKHEAATFARQMAYLATNFRVVSPSAIGTFSAGNGEMLVAITFDDAFANLMDYAVPVLKRHKLPAAINVPVGNLGMLPQWDIPANCSDKTERVMTNEQVISLDNNDFEIFSHTLSHSDLLDLEDDKLITELKESKCLLEEIVGHEIVGISYPHGSCNNRVVRIARECGYRLGFTIEPEMFETDTDPLRIGRFKVLPSESLMKFKLKVSGAYQVTRYSRKFKRIFIRR